MRRATAPREERAEQSTRGTTPTSSAIAERSRMRRRSNYLGKRHQVSTDESLSTASPIAGGSCATQSNTQHPFLPSSDSVPQVELQATLGRGRLSRLRPHRQVAPHS